MFPLLAITNNGDIFLHKLCMDIILIILGISIAVELLGHMVILCLIF